MYCQKKLSRNVSKGISSMHFTCLTRNYEIYNEIRFKRENFTGIKIDEISRPEHTLEEMVNL